MVGIWQDKEKFVFSILGFSGDVFYSKEKNVFTGYNPLILIDLEFLLKK
jgi:hypothetical protein